MSASKKLQGGSTSELTRLKVLWRDSLPEDVREYWRSRFVSSEATQAQIRAEMAKKLSVKLSWDRQLNEFRAWLERQDALEKEAEAMAEDERRLVAEFGDTLTKDQLREKVLNASYFRTLAEGNFELGLATVKMDLKDKEVTLDRDKFQFDATKAAMEKLETLKAIKSNSKLSEDEKLEQARLALFGMAPK